MIGNKEVAGIGMASVTHQIAIQTVEAKTATPSGERPSGFKNNKINKNNIGPKIKPVQRNGVICGGS